MHKFKYLEQNNDHGCGVFATINAINYEFRDIYGYKHVPILEMMLKTDVENGTEQRDIIKFLRFIFYIRSSSKFSKKRLDKWLEKSNRHQAIIMYYAEPSTQTWHYCNIFQKKHNKYYGANFWFPLDKGRIFKTTISEKKVYSFYKYPEGFYIMYLRPRDFPQKSPNQDKNSTSTG